MGEKAVRSIRLITYMQIGEMYMYHHIHVIKMHKSSCTKHFSCIHLNTSFRKGKVNLVF